MTIPLSVHAPEGMPKGGVVVFHEGYGANQHIESVGRRLAAQGWIAVVPHLFHRDGDPTFAYGDSTAVLQELARVDAQQVMEDADAAFDRLAADGIANDRIGVVGFCMGGSLALCVGARRDVGAAVTFYGGGIMTGRFGFGALVDEVKGLRAPWLGLFGDLDPGIPIDHVLTLRSAAASSTHETQVVQYPQAGHGFHCDARSDYHEASAADAWVRTLDWLDQYLVPFETAVVH